MDMLSKTKCKGKGEESTHLQTQVEMKDVQDTVGSGEGGGQRGGINIGLLLPDFWASMLGRYYRNESISGG